MRNANGQGSVVKLSGNRRNKWRVLAPAVRVWSEDKEDYIYKQKTIGCCKTKTEAYNLLYRYTNSPELFKEAKTFEELFNLYMDYKLEQTNSDAVKYHLRRVKIFAESIKHLKIDQINNETYQELFNKSGYAYKSLEAVKAYLYNFYSYLILKKQIDINYIGYVKLKEPEDKKEVGLIYSEEEIQRIWDASDSDRKKILLIYLYSGLRKSELFLIKKENVFLEERYMIGGVKTKAGKNRLIPIHKKILDYIKYFYDKSESYLIDDNVIDFTEGSLLYVTKEFNKVLGNRKHTVHDTRKTFITRLNNVGANVTDIAKIVGHATGMITLDVYTKKDKSQLINTVDLLP